MTALVLVVIGLCVMLLVFCLCAARVIDRYERQHSTWSHPPEDGVVREDKTHE